MFHEDYLLLIKTGSRIANYESKISKLFQNRMFYEDFRDRSL